MHHSREWLLRYGRTAFRIRGRGPGKRNPAPLRETCGAGTFRNPFPVRVAREPPRYEFKLAAFVGTVMIYGSAAPELFAAQRIKLLEDRRGGPEECRLVDLATAPPRGWHRI